jgi:2-polyprenyl-3-methyl-5-hydroxy-6-metoxy-1,4-benzoquinol methylase
MKAPARFGFDRFRDLASDPSLSEAERMDATGGRRDGYDDAMWSALLAILTPLEREGARVLDIGPGCGELARRMIALCERKRHDLVLVDHEEMLAHLPQSDAVTRIGGRFPDAFVARYPDPEPQFDVILAYSVLQYVIYDANPFQFLDAGLARLKPGGVFLIGDVPNFSKLRRFLASEAGLRHHHAYMKTDEPPDLPPFAILKDRIDDGVVLGLVTRARLAGFDAYIVPQAPGLPFADWREDILVRRP